MQFRLTFTNGFSHDFEADRLEDDGNKLELWDGDILVQRVMDSEIISCVCLNSPSIEIGDIYGHRSGVRLYDEGGNLIAAYRTVSAAKEAERN